MCMFRKLFMCGLVLPVLFSCSKTETGVIVSNAFRATISPEIMVRSGESSEVSVTRAVLEAWNGQTRAVRQEISVEPGTETIEFSDVPLAAGFDYDIYIWADSGSWYETSDLRTVSLSSGTGYDGTVEGRDAFYSCSTVHSQQNQAACGVTLKRPFAQVDLNLPSDTQKATVGFSAPTVFDLKTGTVSEIKSFNYEFDCTVKGTTTVSDLLFAGEETMDLEYSFTADEADGLNFTIPVKRNCRTRINTNANN